MNHLLLNHQIKAKLNERMKHDLIMVDNIFHTRDRHSDRQNDVEEHREKVMEKHELQHLVVLVIDGMRMKIYIDKDGKKTEREDVT
jgi:hypothetical protein